VTHLAARHSRLEAVDGMPLTTDHAVLDGHLFTLLTVDHRS
jgi:hypothetical protein